MGYPFDGEWRKPNIKMTSLYAVRKSGDDLIGERAREFGFRVYPSVGEALRCGGDKLAVDGVVLIAEDGGGELLPQCLAVFEPDHHGVPIYNYRGLSADFDKAKTMLDVLRRMKCPVLAGSSLPLTWRLPAIEVPLGCTIEEALMIGVGTEFDAVDALQSMVERRGRGETGVKAVRMVAGEDVWKSDRYSRELLVAALSRSDTPLGLTVADGRTQDLVASGELRKLAKNPTAYFIDYHDGLRASVLMLDGAVQDFNFAARVNGSGVQSAQFLLTPQPNATHSACLMRHIEKLLDTGIAAYPAERVLLAGGILASGRVSKAQGYARVETPHLNVAYRVA